jgi:hypothetical protein
MVFVFKRLVDVGALNATTPPALNSIGIKHTSD